MAPVGYLETSVIYCDNTVRRVLEGGPRGA